MTDHEKLLVALLSADDDLDGPVTAPAVMTMLYQLGDTLRRPSMEQPVRRTA